jgi:hypothetical protein
MGGLFGGGGGGAKVPKYTGIQMQTSAQGLPIPIVYGANRIGVNLIWYNDFKRHAHSAGGKGGLMGGGKGGQTYTYTAAVIMGLCEGAITGIGKVWADKNKPTLTKLNLTLYTGTAAQVAFGYVTTKHPSEARTYAYTAYLASSNYNLGSSPNLPNHNFEVRGLFHGSLSPYSANDVNPADFIPDVLTNTRYGAGLSAGESGDVTALRAYTQAAGLWFSPVLDSQETGGSSLDRWAQICNSWIFWDGTKMRYLPLGDEAISANGATYTPVTTIVYALGPDDFVLDDPNSNPVDVDISDPADAWNTVNVSIKDRDNKDYANVNVEAKDQASRDGFGRVVGPSIGSGEICDLAVGNTIANLLLQRNLYGRRAFAFKLSWEFILLEVGDLVSLTEPGIGLNAFPVRVREISEDDSGLLSIVAEEYPAGIAAAASYNTAGAGGTGNVDTGVDPGDVNAPAVIEPSSALTAGVAQIWIGLSGGVNWGGANVWASLDDITYSQIGVITESARQGTLTATLASHADPDAVNTLAVDLAMSVSNIGTVTHADADAVPPLTLSLVGDEMVAFGAASLTGTYAYDLTYLRRALYGTAAAAHSAGALFTILDDAALLKFNLPASYVGATLYLKFVSFNIFGGAVQDISTLTPTVYVPAGTGFFIAPPTSVTLTRSLVTQADGTTIIQMLVGWTASAGPLLANYDVQFSIDAGATYTPAGTAGATAVSFPIKPAVPSTNYLARVRAVAQGGVNVSAWATSSSVSSGALAAGVPSAPAGLAVAAASLGYAATWAAPTDHTITVFKIYQVAGPAGAFGSAVLVGSVAAPGTSFSRSGLAAGSVYTVFLVATNAVGDSPPTSGIDVTPTSAGGSSALIAAGLTATGTNQATAYAIIADVSIFTTVAAGAPNAGARLPAAPGRYKVLNRDGANALPVYPPSGGTIETLALNAAATVPAIAGETEFSSADGVAWFVGAQTIENRFSFPGAMSAAGASPSVPLAIAVAQTVPANFSGTVGAALTAATSASNVFNVGYYRAGVPTNIGTVTISNTGTITLSTQAAVVLNVGDLFVVTGPASADVTLADFAFTISTTRN